MTNHYCVVHPDRLATGFKTVPCAPEGRLYVCPECEREENLPRVFAAYKAQHGPAIREFKAAQAAPPAGSKKIYLGFRFLGDACVSVYYPEKEYNCPLKPEPSQKIRNHSPDGFEWGYAGSGPAQLAMAILLDVSGDPLLAEALYQAFKRDIVSQLSDTWVIDESAVTMWIKAQKYEPPHLQAN